MARPSRGIGWDYIPMERSTSQSGGERSHPQLPYHGRSFGQSGHSPVNATLPLEA
jgi:hypothetical protein